MSPERKIFGQFLGLALIVAVLLVALGYVPTRRWAGDEALLAMLAGCAVGVVASLFGTIPVFLAKSKPHVEAWTAALAAMGVRLGIVIVSGLALTLAGTLPAKPFLIWLVIAHAGLLVPDTMLSIKILARQALAENR